MLFHGHTTQTLSEITEEQFTEIAIMYVDGQVGNKAIFDALEPVTMAVWNYMSMGKQQHTGEQFYPAQKLYFAKPKPDVGQQLIAMAMSNAMKGS